MRLHLAALGAFLCVASGQPVLWAQSLAEVARQEEERRKSITHESKVYTNDDLQAVPVSPPVAAPAAAAPGAVPPPADAAAAVDPASPAEAAEPPGAEPEARDRAYWSARMKDLQSSLQRTQTYLDAMQSRINGLTTDFVNRDDPAQRALIAEERERAVEEFNRLREQLEKDRQAIADFEEEARRASVPPGWLR